MLHALDIFFLIFHTFIVFFNLLGWIWKKTRKWALGLQLLTGASWTLLSLLLYGELGYCPVTDWHWQVLRKLGHTDLPTSYIKYLLDRITGLDWEIGLVHVLTTGGLVLAFLLTVSLNVRDYLRKKKAAHSA